MLQCRRSEKDFLLRKEVKYLAASQEKCAELIAEAQDAADIAGKAGMTDTQKQAETIITQARTYEGDFKALVAGWEVMGLDHESGL